VTVATVALPTKKPALITPGFLAWLAFLGLCMLIGLVSAYEVLTRGLSVTNMSNTVPWGLWITIDLSAIALGAGAFTLSAIVYVLRLKRFTPIVRLAVYVGFVGYTTALLTLIMDIGRPDRFWHPWVYWNVHSVLWEITWCITLYLVILAAEFLPVVADLSFFSRWPWFRKFAHGVHKFAPVLAVIGLGISLLHQSSLGATYGILRSRPIWFKPSMPIMFILSAVAVGPAVIMAIAFITEWATKRATVPHDVLRAIARFSGFGLLLYAYIKMWDLAAVTYYGRSPQVNQAFAMLNEQTPYGFGFWVVEVIVGIVIPAIFFLSPRFNRRPAYLVVGALCATIGVVANRWNVTVSGLTVPLSYSPGVLYQAEAGSYSPSLTEWGIAIGVIGYALLLLTLGLRFLPLFNGNHNEPSKS
jgi:molybdopterin-containing oxidoreductase family membrane subunit